MDAESIVKVLRDNGWEAEAVRRQDVPDLVEIDGKGLLKCVDGRPSDHPEGMRGPKTLGGVYAIATARGVRDLEGLADIVREVKELGYGPCVHGDEHADPAPMGCGYFKLWSTGALEGLEPPQYSAEEGAEKVKAAGGVYEQLKGSHEERVVMINLVTGTTLEPKAGDQRFVVDAWVCGDFEIDPGPYLLRAAETVQKLGGPLKAKVITE